MPLRAIDCQPAARRLVKTMKEDALKTNAFMHQITMSINRTREWP